MAPTHKWRNRKGLNSTQKKDKVQLRFAIASGLMVAVLAFCGVYGLVNQSTVTSGGFIPRDTAFDPSAPIETEVQAKRYREYFQEQRVHRLLSETSATPTAAPSSSSAPTELSAPTAAPTEISHREGTCPGIPKPSANLFKCTRFETARQNSCEAYFKEDKRTEVTGTADGLGDCKEYKGDNGPYPTAEKSAADHITW